MSQDRRELEIAVRLGPHRRRPASDEGLRARTASEPESFGVFYDRFEAGLLGFFLRATGRADVAAGLTAEVFAEALRSVGTFDPRLGRAKAWPFGIARHKLAAVLECSESLVRQRWDGRADRPALAFVVGHLRAGATSLASSRKSRILRTTAFVI